jgi:hypothetical protein
MPRPTPCRVLRVMKAYKKIMFKNPEARSVSFCLCHRVLTDLTPGFPVSVRSLSTHLLAWQCDDKLVMFYMSFCAFACNIFVLIGGLELFHQDNFY